MSKTAPLEVLVVVDMQDYFLNNMAYDENGHDRPDRGEAATKRLLDGIEREILAAKKKRIPIIVLEYGDLDCDFDTAKECWEYQRTTYDVKRLLARYPLAYFAEKDTNSGYEEVNDILNGVEPRRGMVPYSWRGKANMPRKLLKKGQKAAFTVVGVNASYCVADTCYEMLDAGHKCNIPIDASVDTDTLRFADEVLGADPRLVSLTPKSLEAAA